MTFRLVCRTFKWTSKRTLPSKLFWNPDDLKRFERRRRRRGNRRDLTKPSWWKSTDWNKRRMYSSISADGKITSRRKTKFEMFFNLQRKILCCWIVFWIKRIESSRTEKRKSFDKSSLEISMISATISKLNRFCCTKFWTQSFSTKTSMIIFTTNKFN